MTVRRLSSGSPAELDRGRRVVEAGGRRCGEPHARPVGGGAGHRPLQGGRALLAGQAEGAEQVGADHHRAGHFLRRRQAAAELGRQRDQPERRGDGLHERRLQLGAHDEALVALEQAGIEARQPREVGQPDLLGARQGLVERRLGAGAQVEGEVLGQRLRHGQRRLQLLEIRPHAEPRQRRQRRARRDRTRPTAAR
ncbi:hypothetical protein [Methylobacterium goesingense]|uniref:hypothetical protein n=1 Tax=Methylobacterium TaxID=407 RepID=UPI0012E7E5CC|nr:hypothetical protein [Methylobacterium goesingense]